jgi:hypothetical protein
VRLKESGHLHITDVVLFKAHQNKTFNEMANSEQPCALLKRIEVSLDRSRSVMKLTLLIYLASPLK